jgi:hypothetical protein
LAPAEILVTAEAMDRDGWVSTVEFFANATSLGVTTNNPLSMGPMNPFHLLWTNVAEGDYALVATATDDGGATAVSAPVSIRVLDVATIPTVTVVATDPLAREQSPLVDAMPDTATFSVKRSGSTEALLRVYYHVGGTALNGTDYDKLPGVVEIPAGASSADVIVNPIDDSVAEPPETVVLTLMPPPLGGDPGMPATAYRIGEPEEATALILDNEEQPNVPPAVAIVSPPDGATFVAPDSIRIIASARDPDGWVRSVEFFADGQSLGVVTRDPLLSVTPMDDLHPEWKGIIPFQMVWTNPPAGGYTLTALATDNAGA